MPEVLDEMPKVTRSGRKPLHDYDELFSHGNKPVKLKRDENGNADFKCSVRTMRHNLYRQSKVRDLTIKTVTPDDDTIIFRVLPEEEVKAKKSAAKKITSKLTAKKK
jgi:hypothetical protein